MVVAICFSGRAAPRVRAPITARATREENEQRPGGALWVRGVAALPHYLFVGVGHPGPAAPGPMGWRTPAPEAASETPPAEPAPGLWGGGVPNARLSSASACHATERSSSSARWRSCK